MAVENVFPRWPSLRPFPIGPASDPQMLRWFVLPRNKWFCIYLRKLVKDDEDRALHDHPGPNLSIIFVRGYDEHTFAATPLEGCPLPEVVVQRRKPGAIVFRHAVKAHRLTLIRRADGTTKPSWSLFIMWNKWREWGFICPGGRWVPWQIFNGGVYGGAANSKGCDT